MKEIINFTNYCDYNEHLANLGDGLAESPTLMHGDNKQNKKTVKIGAYLKLSCPLCIVFIYIAKLSPISSPDWAKLALVSLVPAPHPPPTTHRESL